MITLSKGGAYLIGGTEVVETGAGSEEFLTLQRTGSRLTHLPPDLLFFRCQPGGIAPEHAVKHVGQVVSLARAALNLLKAFFIGQRLAQGQMPEHHGNESGDGGEIGYARLQFMIAVKGC